MSLYNLSCLSKVVGIVGDDVYTSDYDIYLDKQAGITTLYSANVASGHTATANELFRQSIDTAKLSLFTDLQTIVSPNYKVRNALEAVRFGSQKTYDFVSQSGAYQMTIESRVNDPLAVMRVQRIGIVSPVSGSISITVSDGLQSQTVAITATANTLAFGTFEFVTPLEELTITYTPLNGTVGDNDLVCQSCNSRNSATMYASANANNAGGLVVDIQQECSKENFICAIRNHVADLLRILACTKFCEFAMFTDRINGFAVNKQRAGEMLAFYEKQYTDAKANFKNSSSAIIGNLNTPCLDCRGNKYSFKTG